MALWRKSEEASPSPQAAIGGDFESAAARVTADEDVARNVAEVPEAAGEEQDRLDIRPEWAVAAAKLCFVPASRVWHPAFALTDDEAQKISPQIQALMQAVADKYAPELLGRVAARHPELFDAAAAIGVLYYQKWRVVVRLQREEAERAAKEAAAVASARTIQMQPSVDAPSLRVPRVGERGEDGSLII